MTNYRAWLALAFLSYIAADLARRFFEGSKALLVVFDLALMAAYLAFFASRKVSLRQSWRGKCMLGATALYVILIVAECANPSPFAQYAVTKVLALRNYLFALPCIWLGYDLASREGRGALRKAAHGFRWVFAIVAVFGIFAYFARGGSLSNEDAERVLTPLGGAVRSFEKGELRLSSSFFATSVRFAFFLLGGFLLLWGYQADHARSHFGLLPLDLLFQIGRASCRGRV